LKKGRRKFPHGAAKANFCPASGVASLFSDTDRI
jgi:hypothetical protein